MLAYPTFLQNLSATRANVHMFEPVDSGIILEVSPIWTHCNLYSHVMECFWSATPIALDFKTVFKMGENVVLMCVVSHNLTVVL